LYRFRFQSGEEEAACGTIQQGARRHSKASAAPGFQLAGNQPYPSRRKRPGLQRVMPTNGRLLLKHLRSKVGGVERITK
jgi:hypothetical protein